MKIHYQVVETDLNRYKREKLSDPIVPVDLDDINEI